MNSETSKPTMPIAGESVEVNTRRGVVAGTVAIVLKNGLVAVTTTDDRRIFARRRADIAGGWEQEDGESAWADPAYVELRKAELKPKLGQKVWLDVLCYLEESVDGDLPCAELSLSGTVVDVDAEAKGRAIIMMDMFEFVADGDYWINAERYANSGRTLGLYFADGELIN